MDHLIAQTFDFLTTGSGQDPAIRNLVCLVACIVLYGIYMNLDRGHARSAAAGRSGARTRS